MKVLISSIGSRGDVQPILALALELRALGHNASLCVAPNFKDWVESFGLACIPIGPDLKVAGGSSPSKPVEPSRAQLRQLAVHTIRGQFQVLAEAARVPRYIFTDRPWLAADPAIAPAFSTHGMRILQTGAWFLSDQTALPDHLENFIANGAPPVYFGFGSMRASEQTSRVLIEAARALGLRSIISQGWANLSLIDAATDCISIGDVNHEKLFTRVAAIVHHGGAGTTTAAVRAGRAQVIIPHTYDQYYWAHRVGKLGVGVSDPTRERLTVNAMVRALRECLRPEMTARAQTLASRIELRGAQIAAERLVSEFG